MVIVPGAAGEIGVLARHAPLIALLQAGSTRVYTNREAEEVQEFATGPGFFTVEQDRALALVDTAVKRPRDRPGGRPGAARGGEGRSSNASRRGESEADRWQLEQRIKAGREPAGPPQADLIAGVCSRHLPAAPSGSVQATRDLDRGAHFAGGRRRAGRTRPRRAQSRFSSRRASTCLTDGMLRWQGPLPADARGDRRVWRPAR
jgi:hypothetical protein